MASAMNPKVTYPNHMPACIAMTNHDMVDDDRPMPPCTGARRGDAGTPPFNPHQANRQQEFISAIATVVPAIPGLKSVLKRPRSVGAAECHIGGSSRWRR